MIELKKRTKKLSGMWFILFLIFSIASGKNSSSSSKTAIHLDLDTSIPLCLAVFTPLFLSRFTIFIFFVVL
jgi:hypothetical protein